MSNFRINTELKYFTSLLSISIFCDFHSTNIVLFTLQVTLQIQIIKTKCEYYYVFSL